MEPSAAIPTGFRAVLGEVLPPGSPVALLDFPWHHNPGDAAIWIAETQVLSDLGHEAVYVASMFDFEPRRLDRLLPRDGVVLLHGGGNLGDLWPALQAHREAVLAALPDRRIVQLPQTVHFDDEGRARRSLALLANHRGLLVLARDRRSRSRLSAAGIDVRLGADPTSAFRLGGGGCTRTEASRVLYLLRDDRERRQEVPERLADLSVDWVEFGKSARTTPVESTLDRSLRLVDRGQRLLDLIAPTPARARSLWYHRHSRRVMARALALLEAHEVVVTDRLHGMLLALALGRRVVAIDTGYGKIDTYIDSFLVDEPLLHRVARPEDVDEVLIALERS